jgi:hypothetical protein
MVGPGGRPFRRPSLSAGSSDLWVFFFTSFKDGLLKAACKNVRVVLNFRLSVYYPSENIKAWRGIMVTFRMFYNFLFPLRFKGYR